MSYISRKTQAIINLSALNENYQIIDKLAKESATIAVIKADAYGHGAIEIAKSLDKLVPAFAVAFIDEAIILRNAGIQSPILILEGPLLQSDFSIALAENFWLMLHNHDQLAWFMAQTTPYLGNIWLKVETGMHRLGFMPDEIPKIVTKIMSRLLLEKSHEQTKELVLCSHFSNAEEINNSKTPKQIQHFDLLCSQVYQQISNQLKPLTSLANSAGIIQWPESRRDYNRLGLALYGINPIINSNLNSSHDMEQSLPLKPVMTLQSVVIGLRTLSKGDCVGYGEIWQASKPSVIATVAIGYADGYPRNAKAGTPVFINGQLAPLVGRVSMDMITVDVTELANVGDIANVADVKKVSLGDYVELWGENLPVDVVAEHTDTISYELLTRISSRLPRKYI